MKVVFIGDFFFLAKNQRTNLASWRLGERIKPCKAAKSQRNTANKVSVLASWRENLFTQRNTANKLSVLERESFHSKNYSEQT